MSSPYYRFLCDWLSTKAIKELEREEKVGFEDLLTQLVYTFLPTEDFNDLQNGDFFKLTQYNNKVWMWDGERLEEYQE